MDCLFKIGVGDEQVEPLQHDYLDQNNDDLEKHTPEYVLSQNVKEYEEYDDGETITNIVAAI